MRTPFRRFADDRGFTLIEILVVILIIGILAAIAIPTLIDQRHKGRDAAAKSTIATAMHGMEIYNNENDGTYACGSTCLADIRRYDLGIPATGIDISAEGSFSGVPSSTSYRVSVTTSDNHTFWADRDSDGTVVRGCDVNGDTNPGGCIGSSW